jgi:hypothetical protein
MAKRSTKDLVESLMEEAEPDDVARAGLVVGFEDRTEVVWSSDPAPLETLNGFMRAGGMPVGIARLKQGGVHVSALRELDGVEWAEKYLATVTAEIMRGLADHLGVDARQVHGVDIEEMLRQIEAKGDE